MGKKKAVAKMASNPRGTRWPGGEGSGALVAPKEEVSREERTVHPHIVD
jgi:hypothetical protein